MQCYSDTFFFYRFDSSNSCLYRFANHALVYVYCGQLEIEGRGLSLQSGESLFVKKGNCLRMIAGATGEKTEIAILHISDDFLREFYFVAARQEIRDVDAECTPRLIPKRANIDSLFRSMEPYYESEASPQKAVLKLKVMEGIYALLETDRMFYTMLFGFATDSNLSASELLSEAYVTPFYWQKTGIMDLSRTVN